MGGPISPSVPIPPSVGVLLSQSRYTWAEAALQTRADERYRSSHVAALRAAAALLAVRARPARVARSRPTSAWVLLDAVAPELAEWSTYFADSAGKRAAIEAGAVHVVSDRDADDLLRATGEFIGLVERMCGVMSARISGAVHESSIVRLDAAS
jgi:SAV_6107-like HEPN